MFLTLLKIINWFLTKKSNVPIVDETPPEKTMEMTTEDLISDIRQWSIDKIHELSDTESPAVDPMYCYMNALAIAEEFDEWIRDYDDPNQQLDIMYLEKIQEVDE